MDGYDSRTSIDMYGEDYSWTKGLRNDKTVITHVMYKMYDSIRTCVIENYHDVTSQTSEQRSELRVSRKPEIIRTFEDDRLIAFAQSF